MPNDLTQENQQLRGLVTDLITAGERILTNKRHDSGCTCTWCRKVAAWDRSLFTAGLYGIRAEETALLPASDSEEDYQTLFNGLESLETTNAKN